MKKLLVYLIKFYQKNISPYKGTKCPYIPSCSAYGLEAITKHGAIKGGVLTVYRILRCNPFSKGGYDPVPDEIRMIHVRDVYCKFRRKNH